MGPLSSLTSRKPRETCFPRTELPEPWTSRRTLLPSLRSSRPMPRQSSTFFLRETRFLLMLRPSRTSSRESPTTSRSSRPTPRLSVTSTPTMSSTGLSTELVSRNSNPGWRVLRSLLLKVLDSAKAAAQKMTTHAEADAEVAGLKERYDKVKSVSDTWVKKVDVLVKEWVLLDNTVT